jgi:polynucleotide 5'-hydroxyl-kinase GRC3/NOL9
LASSGVDDLERRVPPEWRAALDQLLDAPVVLVIGAGEAGKTTFTAWLANTLLARRLTVAIVDADVGQSEIGPPATVGLGAVRQPLARTGEAEPLEFEFVGITSPGRQPWRTAEVTAQLVARARPRFDRVVVDTSGFVAGGFAGAIKQRKIAGVDPDVVVAVQVADECEHILRPLAGRPRPRVVRLPALRGLKPRSAAVRKRHRDAALARHLAGAKTVTLDASQVAVRALNGEPAVLDQIAPGTLVALHTAGGAARALGVIERVDAGAGTLTVRTALRAADVASVTVGAMTVSS